MRLRGPFRVRNGAEDQEGRPIRFYFDGQPMYGRPSDTLAAALLANGVRTIARSFKFRRPRGIFSAGIEEPNALVQLNSGERAILSARAPMVELSDDLRVFSQSGWPSVTTDAGRLLDFVAPLWAAGFYNKTFKWPNWHTYEGAIRRMAGSGQVTALPDPDRYDVGNLHCDVLVVGGGVAGLSAAAAARSAGATVVLVEQAPRLATDAVLDGMPIEGVAANRWAEDVVRFLEESVLVRILTGTTAVGYYDHDVVALHENVRQKPGSQGSPRERYWIVRAKRVVLATGAIEQPLIFCNNDRPGIMLASAARSYIKRHDVSPGRRVVIATNNDSAYLTARDLHAGGVDVAAVVDTRHEVPAAWAEAMRSIDVPVLTGSIPVDTRGFSGLTSVSVGELSSDSKRIRSVRYFNCDALAVSGGWNPTLQLYAQAGGKLAFNPASKALEPVAGRNWPAIVGAAAGFHSLDALVRHAKVIGTSAATEPSGRTTAQAIPHSRNQLLGIRVCPMGKTRRQWVDLRHDVTVADLELAVREQYLSIEHLKRYTTVGMSNDQGKTSSAAAIEIFAKLRGIEADQIGHTTYRPPYTPVSIGAIVGRSVGELYAPLRLLPMHEWHAKNGAFIDVYGDWKRPAAYVKSGETFDVAMAREIKAAREAACLMDASTLGKIELHGPDALELLDRFYIINLATLKPHRARYGIMLRDTGGIFDDGMVAQLGTNHFIVTTTSVNAGRVAAWMQEWHQCKWPELRAAITPVTEQWATLSLTGPRSREILAQLDSDIDISAEAFPHLGVRQGTILGMPTRIFRVSFSGELTYEINVPAGCGTTIWNALFELGSVCGLQPLGLDALGKLRLEKGFFLIGIDTDTSTVPDDVGWGKVAAGKRGDFIGKRALLLPENVRADRLQLVTLVGLGGKEINVGSHVRLPESAEISDGWVTSAGRSSVNGEPIALARIRAGRSHIGSEVALHDSGEITRARVVNSPHFDPTSGRMNA